MKKYDTIKVYVNDQENLNGALKRFKRLCESYGVIKEYRRRRAYAKPSLALKEKRKAAEKRKRKTDNKFKRFGGKI